MTDPELTLVALAVLLESTDAPVRGSQFANRRLGKLWDRARELERAHDRICLTALELTPPELEQIGALCSLPSLGAMRRRDMLQLADQVVATWYDFEARKQVAEALREHQGRALVQDLLQRSARLDAGESSDIVPAERVAQQIWDEVREAWDRPALVKPRGVPTGIKCLDERLTFGGLPRGHITVLGGATSSGKSALANTCLLAAARAKMRILVVALEDDPRAVMTRILATVSGCGNRALQRRDVRPSEKDAFCSAVAEAAGFRLAFLERTSSAERLAATIRSVCVRDAVDLVVVDYLQLVPSGINARSRQEHVDHIFGELVQVARSLPETATLVVSQLHRTKGEVPTKESLYHSGAIEQWSHTIAILWRPETKESTRCVGLLVEKQKNGPTGLVTLAWDPEHVRFSDPEEWEAKRFAELVGKRAA